MASLATSRLLRILISDGSSELSALESGRKKITSDLLFSCSAYWNFRFLVSQ